jgi:IS1 family transposase/transposase-like protein
LKRKILRNISCPNENCKDFNKKMTGHLKVACTYKVYRGTLTRKEFQCESCGSYFSETYSTFYYCRKTPPEKVETVLNHLVRGVGIRDTAELVKVSKDTVERIIINSQKYIEYWYDSLSIQLPAGNIEYDEMWTFVCRKYSSKEDCGEMWIWIAFHRELRFMVNFKIGKHTADLGKELVEETKGLITHPSQHSSDELPCYKEIFNEVYGELVIPERTGKRGRPKKPYLEADNSVTYGQVKKTRKGNKITDVSKSSVYGNMKNENISTSRIERNNLNNRQDNSRLSRKKITYSKDKSYLIASFWLYFLL